MRLSVVVAAMLLAAQVRAAGPEEAKAHYKKGLALYALEKFGDAALEYEAAFEIEPDPALLYNAAQAHRLAGNKQRALALYQNYLRMFPQQPNLKDVHRHIGALKTAIESETKARGSPPTDPIRPAEKPQPKEVEAAPSPPPQVVEVKPGPPEVVVARRAPQKKRTPGWVWGVVGGVAVVVVGVGLGVGLGLGLSGTDYPTANIGTVNVE
jgi:tetratricopeptide (TPR) repeat protein